MENEKKLKPCPFCGGSAGTHRRRSSIRYRAYRKEDIPKNGTFLREIKFADGLKIYEYAKAEFGAWCLDTSCIGRVSKVFPSEAEAIEAWNRRAEHGK